MTITDRDMRDQVIRSLTGNEDDFDVDGIVREIIDAYGLVDIEDVDYHVYWGIVEKHDKSA